jgi:isocitrate/isopropylmalate dehydrogenase
VYLETAIRKTAVSVDDGRVGLRDRNTDDCADGDAQLHHGAPLFPVAGNQVNAIARCAGGMMMDTLGETKIAQAIDKAVHQALDSKQIKSLAAGRMGMGTREVGDLIAKLVS